MISDPTASESPSTLYVGLAPGGSNAASPVVLLKLARNGVMESGEFAYGRRYLAEPASFPLNPDHLPLRDAPFLLEIQQGRTLRRNASRPACRSRSEYSGGSLGGARPKATFIHDGKRHIAMEDPALAASCTRLRGMVARFELENVRAAVMEDDDVPAA